MTSIAEIGAELDRLEAREAGGLPNSAEDHASRLLGLGEQVLEHWIQARGQEPTAETREGFRILALHRQGAKGDPSFNACRETCRELAFHYNLIQYEPDHAETPRRAEMMRLVATHLYLFISGKMQVAGLGEFCCASRPVRTAAAEMT